MYIANKCPGRPFLTFLDSPLIKAVVKLTLKEEKVRFILNFLSSKQLYNLIRLEQNDDVDRSQIRFIPFIDLRCLCVCVFFFTKFILVLRVWSRFVPGVFSL